MDKTEKFLDRLAFENAVLVSVLAARGSVPRAPGAWMAVFERDAIGSVGGGHLEYQALAQARARLGGQVLEQVLRYPLGPALGQCCGGEVQLCFDSVSAADIDVLRKRLQPVRHPVALFGGGHVGQALVRVLAELPFQVTWIDSRDSIFPQELPGNVRCEFSEPVQAAVVALSSGSRVLIMSFSHAEDLDVLAACLMRQRQQADLPYVGLLGSRTKWASFRQRLLARGLQDQELAHVTCPIGVAGIVGKAPEVIAVAVAAQLLQTCGGTVS